MANMIQQQIRENSMELHDFLSDLQSWEKNMKQRDKQLKESKKEDIHEPRPLAPGVPPVRGRAKPTVKPPEERASEGSRPNGASIGTGASANASAPQSAAHHTYDYFRDKWDKFDVDAALKEVDEGDRGEKKAQAQASTSGRSASGIKAQPSERKRPHAELASASKLVSPPTTMEVDERPPDATSEKDRGNDLFKSGKYAEAMQAYSSSIALQPTAVAYANRAMAALKLKRYEEAEADSTEALSLDDRYVKAYSRRGTARRELKKYLQAVEDFEYALRLEPDNKEAKKQYADAKELCEKNARLRPPTTDTAPVHIPLSHSPTQPSPTTAAQTTTTHDARFEAVQSTAEARGTVSAASVSAVPSTSASVGQPKVESLAGVSGRKLPEVTQPGPASMPHGKAPLERPAGPRRGATAVATAGATEILMKKMADKSDVSARSYAELLSLWKAFAGDPPSQAKILRNLDPQSLPKIFKDELTPWFIVEIAKNLQTCFLPVEVKRAVDILEGLTKCSRFDMVVRCLLSKQKDDVRAVLNMTVPETDSDLQSRLDGLKRKFAV